MPLTDYRANSNPDPGAQSSNKPLLIAFDASSTPIFDSLEITGDLILDAYTGVIYGDGSSPAIAMDLVSSDGSVTITVDTGAAEIDFSTSSPAGGFASNEIPVGAIDSSNRIFTLANTPNPAASNQLFLNGVLMRYAIDYTLIGNTITYSIGATPQIGDNHYAFYQF